MSVLLAQVRLSTMVRLAHPRCDEAMTTSSTLAAAATAATAVAAAASGGVFVAYSTFTGTALRRLPASEAIATMQQVNLAAPRSPVFMLLLFVPAATAAALAVRAVVARDPGSAWLVTGAGVYLLGVVVTTVAFHVPRNDLLAGWAPGTHTAQWDGWLSSWLAGNHVRAAAGLVSSALLAWSLRA